MFEAMVFLFLVALTVISAFSLAGNSRNSKTLDDILRSLAAPSPRAGQAPGVFSQQPANFAQPQHSAAASADAVTGRAASLKAPLEHVTAAFPAAYPPDPAYDPTYPVATAFPAAAPAAPDPDPDPAFAPAYPAPAYPAPAYPAPAYPAPATAAAAAAPATAATAAAAAPAAPAAAPPDAWRPLPQFQAAPPQQQPWQAPARPPRPADPQAAGQKRSLENVFGRNILGIVASILVFIGLIFLGFIVVPALSDMAKIALMFVLSSALAAGGIVLTRRHPSIFSQSLLGCGCGAFFISIQITHLYFNAINEIVAYALLLLWLIASLFLSRQAHSQLVGIIAHAGMVFSVCAGYLVGVSDEKLVLLMLYQLAASAVVVAGGITCCRKLYSTGLFTTLLLTLFASVVMWSRFMGNSEAFASSLPTAIISAAFFIQFLTATALVCLLLAHARRLADASISNLLGIFTAALWQASLFVDVTLTVSKLVMASGARALGSLPLSHYGTVPLALAVALLVSLAAIAIVAALGGRLGRQSLVRSLLTTLLCCCFCSLFAQFAVNVATTDILNPGEYGPQIAWIALLAPLCLALARQTKDSLYLWFGMAFCAADLALMLLRGFRSLCLLAGEWLPIACLLATLAVAIACFAQFKPAERAARRNTFTIILVLAWEMGIANILLFAFSGFVDDFSARNMISLAALALCLLAPLLAMQLLRLTRPAVFYHVHNNVMVMLVAVMMYAYSYSKFALFPFMFNEPWHPLILILFAMACACACAMIFLNVRARAGGSNPERLPGGIEVLSAISLHLLVLCALAAFSGSHDTSYQLSLSSMVVALAIVVAGFWTRLRSLRLYGLVVVIACVLKLVLLDVGGLDTVMRVVAFIGGGGVCFGISALYNFAVKRLEPARGTAAPSQLR